MEFTPISKTSVLFRREQAFAQPFGTVEAFGDFWCAIQGEFEPGDVALRARGKEIFPRPDDRILVAPGSVIEWKLRPCRVTLFCLVSKLPWPAGWGGEPLLVRGAGSMPLTSDRLGALPAPVESVLKNETSNPYALRLRAILLREFREHRPISSYARELGVSQEVLGRYFKACFGISPVKFRNLLRIHQAYFELMFQEDLASQVCFKQGFGDLSQFYREFKKVIRVRPGQFRL